MTVRSIIIGLLCAAALNAVCFFNDFVIRQTFLVGNYMPISMYGGLLLFVLLANPCLARISKKAALSGRELAVILALTLVAGYVPGRGLMHYFMTFLMLPHHYERIEPGWKQEGVLEMVPRQMLADIRGNESEALNGFVQGLAEGKEHISFRQIPLEAWTQTLQFWLPLLIAIAVALIGLAVVVHRQWSDHEHIAYPIVQFADALLPREGGRVSSLFRNKFFWLSTCAIMTLHLNNYAYRWWPEKLVQMPVYYDFTSLSPLFPTLRLGGIWRLFNPTIYFTAVGFAYLLATDVSLSLGLAPYLYAYVFGLFARYGISLEGSAGGFFAIRVRTFLYGGAYTGMFLALLYTGRHYYRSVFQRSLGLRAPEEVEGTAVWGARLFLAGCLVFIAQLVRVGLDWQLAVLYTAGAVMIFLVTSRVVAETGTFFIHPYFFPCVLLSGFMGPKALGPQSLLILFMVTSLLLIDPREAVMPFMVHGLKLVDMNRVKTGKTAVWATVAMLLAFAIATPMTLYWQYDRGAFATGDGWTARAVPRFAFDETVRIKQRLEAQGNLERAESVRGWGRFLEIDPNGPCVFGFAVTLSLVLLFTAARLRIPWWPLHPVIFLVLGTYQSRTLAASFLLGCLIKIIVTKYGGAAGYQKVKPFMLGLIAGDMLGGILPMLIGAGYYLLTGELPQSYKVMP